MNPAKSWKIMHNKMCDNCVTFYFQRNKFGHVIHHSDMIFDGNGWYDIRIKQQKFALVSIQKHAYTYFFVAMV